MEIKTLVMVTITIVLVLVPFAFVYIKNNSKNSKTKSLLMRYAAEYNSNIDESEILSNIAIGIDFSQQRLFFIKRFKENESKQTINLYDIKNVKLVNEKRTVKIGKSNTLVVEKIDIILTNKISNSRNYILELYNENINMALTGEVQLANKWVAIIDKALK